MRRREAGGREGGWGPGSSRPALSAPASRRVGAAAAAGGLGRGAGRSGRASHAVQCAGCPGDGFSPLARGSRYCLTRGRLTDCDLVHAPRRQHRAPDRPPTPVDCPCVPLKRGSQSRRGAGEGSGRYCTSRGDRSLLEPQSEPGRGSSSRPTTTVRVSRRNPRPAQVGRVLGGEHRPGAAERPASQGDEGRAPAPKH